MLGHYTTVHTALLGTLCMDFEFYISKLAFVFIINNVTGVAITHVILVLVLQLFVTGNNWIPKILLTAKCILVHKTIKLHLPAFVSNK
jgi:hypothetical protein